MPININNEKARRQYHNTVLQIMAKLERSLSNKVKPLINRQYMDAASLITHGVTDVNHVVNNQTTRLKQLLQAHYRRVAITAGRNSILYFEKGQKGMNESFWNDINQYIALNTGRKITQMQDTTKKMIAGAIGKGVAEGETNREIATRLRNTGKVDSRFRALRIARTETLGMFNSATDASVRETGLKFVRVWSASKDLRTRRRKKGSIYDHWVADGLKTAQNEDFIVSGEPLSYPGDPKGSAGNIINCRCVLLYERDRSNEYNQQTFAEGDPVLNQKPILSTTSVDDAALSLFENTNSLEKEALDMYSLDRYQPWNSYLRTEYDQNLVNDLDFMSGVNVDNFTDDEYWDFIKSEKKKIAALKGVFKNKKIVRYKGETYRGVGFNSLDEMVEFQELLGSNTEISLPGFTSTSISEKEATKFIKRSNFARIKIRSDKGISLDKVARAGSKEKEILFDHNSKFKIVEVERYKDEFLDIVLEQVD